MLNVVKSHRVHIFNVVLFSYPTCIRYVDKLIMSSILWRWDEIENTLWHLATFAFYHGIYHFWHNLGRHLAKNYAKFTYDTFTFFLVFSSFVFVFFILHSSMFSFYSKKYILFWIQNNFFRERKFEAAF